MVFRNFNHVTISSLLSSVTGFDGFKIIVFHLCKIGLHLTKGLWGKMFGILWDQGLQLITTLRKNMKPQLLPLWDKLMLRKRSLIETVNDQLKKISQIEHTRHRSADNWMVNLVSGLISYTWQDKKPSLQFTDEEKVQLQRINSETPLIC